MTVASNRLQRMALRAAAEPERVGRGLGEA